MPTYAQLLAECDALFPVCADAMCFCEHTPRECCLFCYLALAPEADEIYWGDDFESTLRELLLAAVQSIADYLAWAGAEPIRENRAMACCRGLGASKALLESDNLFYG